VFVKMLSTALSQHSDAVFIDLLTYADLEMLKARKTGRPPPNNGAKNNNKRYVILTYVVEFDRYCGQLVGVVIGRLVGWWLVLVVLVVCVGSLVGVVVLS
jgi:F0F1-type ATP synthase assembly protein I